MCKPEWKYHCSQGLLAKLLFLFQFPGLGGFLRSIAITPLYFCVGLFGFFIVVCLQKLKVPNFRNSMKKFIGVLQTPVIWKTGPIKGLLSASDIWEDLSHPKYRKPPKLTVLRRTCCPEQMSSVKSRGAGGGFAEGNGMFWRHCSNRNVWVWPMPLTWQQQVILQPFSLQGDHPENVWLKYWTLHCECNYYRIITEFCNNLQYYRNKPPHLAKSDA